MSKKVYIRRGHNNGSVAGNYDSGAVGFYKECDLTYEIGDYVVSMLKSAGYAVRTNSSSSINTICADANNWGADIFVDIHFNAGGGNGAEVYFYTGSTNGKKLATNILNKIGSVTEMGISRGIKHRTTDGTLRLTNMPSNVVECGFVDTKTDMDNVSTTAERKLMAKAIVEGIKAYYNDTSSTSTSSASSSTSSSSASTSTSTSTTTSSSSKPAYVSRGYLQKGDVDRGSYKQIKSLEIKLKKMGLYKGAIDGDFGSGVDSGVRKFQKIFGLTVDGKFGSKSKAMLNKLWAYRGILKQGSQGTYVKYLQLLLNGTGAGLTVDGQFGTLTGNAVYNLQKANGLTVDRIAGNQTFTTLIK